MRNGGWCRHQPPLSQFLLSSSEEPDVRCRAVRVSASALLLGILPLAFPSLALRSRWTVFGKWVRLAPRASSSTCPLPLPSAVLRRAWHPSPEASGPDLALLLRPFPFALPSLALQLRWTAGESGFGFRLALLLFAALLRVSLPSSLRMPASLAAPLPEALVRCLAAAPGHKRKLTGRSDSRQRNPPVDN
jgi:hypothetical protein